MRFTRGLAASSIIIIQALAPAVARGQDPTSAPAFHELTYERFAPPTSSRRIRTTLHVRADGAFTIAVDQGDDEGAGRVIDKAGTLDVAERAALEKDIASSHLELQPSDLRPWKPIGFGHLIGEYRLKVNQAASYSLSVDGAPAHTGYVGFPRDESTAAAMDPLLGRLENIVLNEAGTLPNGNVAFVELTYMHVSPESTPGWVWRYYYLQISMDGRATIERHIGATVETQIAQLDGETMRALSAARTKAGQLKNLEDTGPRRPGVDRRAYPSFFLSYLDPSRDLRPGAQAARSRMVPGCVGFYRDDRMKERLDPLIELLERLGDRLAGTAALTSVEGVIDVGPGGEVVVRPLGPDFKPDPKATSAVVRNEPYAGLFRRYAGYTVNAEGTSPASQATTRELVVSGLHHRCGVVPRVTPCGPEMTPSDVLLPDVVAFRDITGSGDAAWLGVNVLPVDSRTPRIGWVPASACFERPLEPAVGPTPGMASSLLVPR
jgi:hypothetical protein